MRNIFVFSRKGGVGKSSTCLLLGLTLREAGHPVRWRDFDPQSSLLACLDHLGEPLADAEDGVVIGDFPPSLESPTLKSNLRKADLIIIPTNLSALDKSSLIRTLEFLKGDVGADPKKLRILLSMVRTMTKEFLAREEFLKSLKVKSFKTAIPLKSSFSRLPMDGLKAHQPAEKELAASLALEALR